MDTTRTELERVGRGAEKGVLVVGHDEGGQGGRAGNDEDEGESGDAGDGILFRDPNQQRGTQALRMGDGSCGQKKTYRGPVISRRKLAVAVREVRRYRQWEHARCDLSRARYGLSRPGPAVTSLSKHGRGRSRRIAGDAAVFL